MPMRYGVQHARLKQATGTPERARGGAVALRPRFPELRFSPTTTTCFPGVVIGSLLSAVRVHVGTLRVVITLVRVSEI